MLKGHTDAVLAVDAHDGQELIVSGGMQNDRTVRVSTEFIVYVLLGVDEVADS